MRQDVKPHLTAECREWLKAPYVMRQSRNAAMADVASASGCYRGFVRRPMKRTTPVRVSRIMKRNG